jgi:SAM-dependent methyltransferase
VERLFRRIYPEYRHRWEVYNELLCKHLTRETAWLDIGCGLNEYVSDFGERAKSSLGVDRESIPGRSPSPFLQADIRKIPLPDCCANLVTLRMVAEHLEYIPDDFSEINRLLSPGGVLIVLTTNTLSPMIFLPRLIPFSLKRLIIYMLFDVKDTDVLPTYHRFNTPAKLRKGVYDLCLSELLFLEEVPFGRSILTMIFELWYTVTAISHLHSFRSSLLAVYRKRETPGEGGFLNGSFIP